jgi:hypothetical protein
VLSIPRCNGGSKQLRPELVGSNRCTIPGFAATSQTPVLALCRTLLATGFDPAQSLEIYRGNALALRVRSIGEAARLTVEDSRLGQPRFRRWRDRQASDGAAPPVAETTPEAVP